MRDHLQSIDRQFQSEMDVCLHVYMNFFFSYHENNFALFSQKKNNKHRNFKIHGRCNAYSWLWLWSQVPRVLFSATNGDSYQTMHRFLQNQSNKCITLYVTKAASSITICTYTYHVMYVCL